MLTLNIISKFRAETQLAFISHPIRHRDPQLWYEECIKIQKEGVIAVEILASLR
jgi:hypothetical protein